MPSCSKLTDWKWLVESDSGYLSRGALVWTSWLSFIHPFLLQVWHFIFTHDPEDQTECLLYPWDLISVYTYLHGQRGVRCSDMPPKRWQILRIYCWWSHIVWENIGLRSVCVGLCPCDSPSQKHNRAFILKVYPVNSPSEIFEKTGPP